MCSTVPAFMNLSKAKYVTERLPLKRSAPQTVHPEGKFIQSYSTDNNVSHISLFYILRCFEIQWHFTDFHNNHAL